MKILAHLVAVALLFVMTISCQSASAADSLDGRFLGSFPFYHGDYPYYDGNYPPAILIAPFGYYGCSAGCCRRAVWRGRHWKNVTACR